MRLSYSSNHVFDYCPRKFQLQKLLDIGEAMPEREDTSHTMYGRAVGAGIAELLTTGGDIERACGMLLANWDYRLEAAPKYLQTAFACLFALAPGGVHAFPFDDYGPLLLPDGSIAAEVGIKIWLDPAGEQDYNVGFVDAIMLHKPSNRPTIIEVKTTTRSGDVRPYYVNSPQSIEYSFALPDLFPDYAESDWNTVYLVLQVLNTHTPVAHVLLIEHTFEDRLNTLMAMMLRYEYISKMRELGFFPKQNSGTCVDWNRVCEFFGVCDNLAQSCPQLPLSVQNALGEPRASQIKIELQLQELLAREMAHQPYGGDISAPINREM